LPLGAWTSKACCLDDMSDLLDACRSSSWK
jgi:hypothetical protein